ncbi:hypothetical protein HOLleu_20136 [Holothuria leucospilota]|uniref:Sulfotransferase n=1 Tax=Holothuria leucospilota TaxID=206669 RepID=A0A9Q1H5H4_HOLLE|nr:hypothetical protein HOLleu_20136 [Holothuria leucospilota]
MYPERREEFRDAVVNYMHVPKSGGTTMKECMKVIARRRHMTSPVLLHTDSRVKETESILNEDESGIMRDIPLFMGDYSFGFCDVIHEKVGKNCSAFIMLREPFDRLVSHYFYCIKLNQSVPGIPDCRTHPIKEWAMSTKSILWNQLFTDIDCSRRQDGKWQCATNCKALPNAYILSQNVSYLQSVVASLDKHFSVIGLTEDYPNSLRMLQLAYNMSFYDVCSRINYNVGTYETVDPNRPYLNKEQTRNTVVKGRIRLPWVKRLPNPKQRFAPLPRLLSGVRLESL